MAIQTYLTLWRNIFKSTKGIKPRLPPKFVRGGEEAKNDWKFVESIWSDLNQHSMCRHSYVLVVGGGAALDLIGFAASTAHRGVRLVRFPTTTLSQGDGGVGVKNGINFLAKKIGSVHLRCQMQ